MTTDTTGSARERLGPGELRRRCEGTPYMLKIGYREVGDDDVFGSWLDLDKDQIIKGLNEVLPAGMEVGPTVEIPPEE